MQKVTHNERCAACKRTLATLLRRAAGNVSEQHDLRLPARLEDYRGAPPFETLASIHQALQEHRGFATFVAARHLPRVDFFLPLQRVVVEFDESQHFTEPRRIALQAYPGTFPLGYDRRRWLQLCKRLQCRDNSPPYRDEQRAWYDTLRDFSATILKNRPTVRLFARDRRWCSLDPSNEADVASFSEGYLARSFDFAPT